MHSLQGRDPALSETLGGSQEEFRPRIKKRQLKPQKKKRQNEDRYSELENTLQRI